MDPVLTGDRPEVTGEQDLSAKLANGLDGLDHRDRVAVAITTHRHQIGYMAEERTEDVATQAHSLLREPHHQAVGRLPARRRVQLQAPPAEHQLELLVNDDGWNRGALPGRWAAGTFHCVGDRCCDLLRP